MCVSRGESERMKYSSMHFLDRPDLRVTLVKITTVVPLLALFHLIFFHGISLWRVVMAIFMTIVDTGTCMTVINHRFFAHRAFETTRLTQFILGWIGCLAYQQGPMWWAVKHRRHHRTCDTPDDPHSWVQTNYMYAWIGWTMDPKEGLIEEEYLGALSKFPELWLCDRFWFMPPMALTYGLWKWGMHPAYPLMVMLACRLITLHFNCVFHPPEGEELCEYVVGGASKVCRAIDVMRGPIDFMADAVGEAHHDDHHVHPSRAKRPGRDYAYLYCIRPMVWLGLAWSPKSMAGDEIVITKPQYDPTATGQTPAKEQTGPKSSNGDAYPIKGDKKTS